MVLKDFPLFRSLPIQVFLSFSIMEIKKVDPFMMTKGETKYLGVNLTREATHLWTKTREY